MQASPEWHVLLQQDDLQAFMLAYKYLIQSLE